MEAALSSADADREEAVAELAATMKAEVSCSSVWSCGSLLLSQVAARPPPLWGTALLICRRLPSNFVARKYFYSFTRDAALCVCFGCILYY